MLDPNQTVASLVRNHPECAGIFQEKQIDYCCKGNRSLSEVCENSSLDIHGLLEELNQKITERRNFIPTKPAELSTPDLIALITRKHHGYLRKALPLITMLSNKVAHKHRDTNSNLVELNRNVQELSEFLLSHIEEEENALFPALVSERINSEKIKIQLSTMADDHEEIARFLERIRSNSQNFEFPEDACNSYRALFTELEHLERDVHEHVHLENHVLKPRFNL